MATRGRVFWKRMGLGNVGRGTDDWNQWGNCTGWVHKKTLLEVQQG